MELDPVTGIPCCNAMFFYFPHPKISDYNPPIKRICIRSGLVIPLFKLTKTSFLSYSEVYMVK